MVKYCVGTIIVSILLCMARPSLAESIRFGHIGLDGTYLFSVAEKFANCIEDSTEHDVEMLDSLFYGGENDLLERVQYGMYEFALVGRGIVQYVPNLQAFYAPLSIHSRGHARVLWDEEGKGLFSAQYQGFEIVALIAGHFFHIANDVRPIYDDDDLLGLRVRSDGWGELNDFLSDRGVRVDSDPFSEIDGHVSSLEALEASGALEYFDYLSIASIAYYPYFILASEHVYDSIFIEESWGGFFECVSQIHDYSDNMMAEMEGDILKEVREAGIRVDDLVIDDRYDTFIDQLRDMNEYGTLSELSDFLEDQKTSTPETCSAAACSRGTQCCRDGRCRERCS